LGDVRRQPGVVGTPIRAYAADLTQPALPTGGPPVVTGNVRQAWEQASAAIKVLDPESVARRTGVRPVAGGVEVRFLADRYAVDFSQGQVRALEGQSPEPDAVLKTLLAHYLLGAGGELLAGAHASFREFPGGEVYYGPFVARTVGPLVACFGVRPSSLVRAATALGGQPAALGDAAATIKVLPRLPLTAVIWKGDEEISPSGNLLFDRSACSYLPLEDLVVAAERTVRALLMIARAGEGEEGRR
jgi:hypothetical protein